MSYRKVEHSRPYSYISDLDQHDDGIHEVFDDPSVPEADADLDPPPIVSVLDEDGEYGDLKEGDVVIYDAVNPTDGVWVYRDTETHLAQHVDTPDADDIEAAVELDREWLDDQPADEWGDADWRDMPAGATIMLLDRVDDDERHDALADVAARAW